MREAEWHQRPSWRAAAVVFITGVVVLSYVRLFFGVDFTDEAFYAANCERLVNGAVPFVDEAGMVQHTTCVLAYPFSWLWEETSGSTGVVLYMRHLHFALTLLIFAVVLVALRRMLGKAPWVWVLAAIALAFIPFNLPSLSYNSVGCAMFLAGSCCVMWATAGGGTRSAVLGGFLNGVAFFAYPPLLVPVLVQAGVAVALVRERRLLIALLAPVALWCLAFLALAVAVGPSEFRAAADDATNYLRQSGGPDKAWEVLRTTFEGFPYKYVAVVLLTGAWIIRRRAPLMAALLLVALPLSALPELGTMTSDQASLFFVRNFSILGGALYLFARHDPQAVHAFRILWVPGMAAGVVTAMASANGALNFGIGSVPAALAAVLFTVVACSTLVGERPQLKPAAVLAASAGTVAVLVGLQFTSTYRDEPVYKLRAAIDGGPYAGLRTSETRRDFVKETTRVIRENVGSGDRVLFFDDFPAGYLFTSAAPATNATWLYKVSDLQDGNVRGYRRILLSYLAKRRMPSVAIQVLGKPQGSQRRRPTDYRPSADPIFPLLARDYRSVRRGDFVVSHRN